MRISNPLPLLLASMIAVGAEVPLPSGTFFAADFNGGTESAFLAKTYVLEDGPSGKALSIAQSDPTQIKNTSAALPVDAMRGKKVTLRARIRGENVSIPPKSYQGAKFMLIITTDDGKKDYPQAPLKTGTWDWTDAAFTVAIPANASKLDLVLGLELASGKLSFDDIRVSQANAVGEGAAGMPEPGRDAAATTAMGKAAWSTAEADLWRKRVLAAGGVAPAQARYFSNEKTFINPAPPRAYSSKTKLRGMAHLAPGSFDPASLVIRSGERSFAVGADVLLDPVWGGLGLASNSSLGPKDEVLLSYRLSSRRLDALVKAADGSERIRAGTSTLLIPPFPELQPGDTLLARIFIDYHSDGTVFDVLPILEDAAKAPSLTTGPQRLPKTTAKIKSGQSATIVCWGDSVTEGGDLEPGQRHGDLLAAYLKAKYPAVSVQTMAVGGSASRQWLFDLPPAEQHSRKTETRFQRILDAKPDLVVIEFVNDQWLSKAAALAHYREKIILPLRAIGAEVLLLTPQRNWERKGSYRDPDTREYVAALREIGRTDEGVGLADMAGRWEHLWKEGIPFPCYLANGFNHPDARGHRLFMEEVVRALGL
ncbi:MAG: SGNH/GDSL hydrolase family protein [Spirochaetes bacterium]|nr:SGNH/GDSL hydrolase family protein [Spirochaetota bacterium]